MKILTLNPPFIKNFSRASRSPCVAKGGTIYFPYFLAYATGVLEKNNFNVKLVDAISNDWSHEQTIGFIKKFKPDLAILDTSTPSIINDSNFASKIKSILPSCHVCLVGTHPTYLPEKTLKMSRIDSVCRSEYDYTVLDLAQTLEKRKSLKSISGLSFKIKNNIIHNKPRPLIKNLDELPFVSEVYKKHLDIKKYFYASVRWPELTILTARGCPYNCSFCNSPFKASYRPRSAKNVVEEFEYIQSEFPEVKEIMIEDETFPAVKKRTVDLCSLMIKRKTKLAWSCNARVDTDEQTLNKMKQANCRLLCVGFESPEQSMLNSVHKKTTKQIQIDFMKLTRKIGLLVNGCFILGLPGDTKDSTKKTIDFAKKLNCDTSQFYPIMVYPGTEAYHWAKSKGYLLTEDYSKWLTSSGLHTTTIDRPELPADELIKICNQARVEYYIRPKYIFSKIIQIIKTPSEATRLFKGGKKIFKHLIFGSK